MPNTHLLDIFTPLKHEFIMFFILLILIVQLNSEKNAHSMYICMYINMKIKYMKKMQKSKKIFFNEELVVGAEACLAILLQCQKACLEVKAASGSRIG